MDVDDFFRRQYGLITRTQAATVGLTDRQIDHRLATGAWARERTSVYRLNAIAPTWESDLLGAVLSADGLASHRCAAALWRLEPFFAPTVELSVPQGAWARLEGVITHHSTQWNRRDPCERRGIPCTGIERTILDAGAVVSIRTLERIAESAIRQRHTSWHDLLRSLARHSIQGRTGCGRLRELLGLRMGQGAIPLSDFSRLVANLLVDAGLPAPTLEFPITDDAGELILQTDLAWPDRKKAWELDGLAFHFGRAEIERDRRKRNRAKSHGWNIQEILWSMYIDEPAELVATAGRFLAIS